MEPDVAVWESEKVWKLRGLKCQWQKGKELIEGKEYEPIEKEGQGSRREYKT